MATQADLDAVITQLQTSEANQQQRLANYQNAVNTVIASMQAKIAASSGGRPIDLSSEVTALQAVASGLDGETLTPPTDPTADTSSTNTTTSPAASD